MSGEKIFAETTSRNCADGEAGRTHQREQSYDGETDKIQNPARSYIPIYVFDERAGGGGVR